MKYNEYKYRQERFLIVTEDHILSVKNKKSVRRILHIRQLHAVTINLQKTKEMVLHVQGDKDIRFLIQQR